MIVINGKTYKWSEAVSHTFLSVLQTAGYHFEDRYYSNQRFFLYCAEMGTCCILLSFIGQLGWWGWRWGEKSRGDKNRLVKNQKVHIVCWSVVKFCKCKCFFCFSEPKVSEKKKLMEKIKEKENRLKKKQQALKNKELEDEVIIFFPFYNFNHFSDNAHYWCPL